MKQKIAHIALVVHDYDEAIRFYTEKLNFRLIEDTILSETKRWILVAPKIQKVAVYYWQKLRMKNKKAGLGIKPAVGFFYF